MAEITNVPSIEITDTGVSVPETSAILAGVLQDYNAAFGGNLNISNVATPQGYLAQETTANITALNAAIAELFSSVDPAYASGRMQDAIARIYFITRKAATKTTVSALCTGSPGITRPAGSQARDTNGNIYSSVSAGTFDKTGQATITFACNIPGPIPCGISSLTQIMIAVPGWDAITNLVPGIPGAAVENREDFENRRYQSVAKNATGTNEAILANVFDLPGVTDCYVIDNPEDESVKVGSTNYNLLPHSVYVGVVGGDEMQIAETIWERKDLGCNMNGNTTVTVYDDSALSAPYPQYVITFNRPTAVPILFAVTIQNNNLLPSDITKQIQQAIITAFNGEMQGIDRERMASSIFASTYYGVISGISNLLNIVSVLIGISEATANTVEMGIDQYPTISAENITVNLQ